VLAPVRGGGGGCTVAGEEDDFLEAFLEAGPLGCFLRRPSAEFRDVIRTPTMPKMKERFEVGTFKRSKLVNVKTNIMR
jgi:hypothetical protein